jgi:CheY-like chemotaxis protein
MRNRPFVQDGDIMLLDRSTLLAALRACGTMSFASDVVRPVARPAAQRSGVDADGFEGRLLYVEDNVRIAEITEMMLEDLGFEVTWAESGEEALQRIDDAPEPFDLVFSDVVMPGISGVGLAKRLARDCPDLPVVLTSGFSAELVAGFGSEFELLQKPFTRAALIDVLRRHLDQRRPH